MKQTCVICEREFDSILGENVCPICNSNLNYANSLARKDLLKQLVINRDKKTTGGKTNG